MARIYTVKKAQKDQGTCGSCGEPIRVGDPYKWCKPRAGRFTTGHKRVRCAKCPSWKPSELTSSPVLSTIYAAQEAADTAVTSSIEAAADALREFAESVREAAEMREESAQNIEDGFGHETYQSEQLREEGQELESWADEVESAADDLDPDDLPCGDCGLTEEEGVHDDFVATRTGPGSEEEEDEVCSECGSPEEDHHEFEADESSKVEEVWDVVYNCPI